MVRLTAHHFLYLKTGVLMKTFLKHMIYSCLKAVGFGVLIATVVISVSRCAGAASFTYTVRPGDTLTEVVRAQHITDRMTLEQALVGVFQVNPKAFGNENMNLLIKGAALQFDSMPVVPQALARKTVQEQYDIFLHGQSPRQKTVDTLRVAKEYQIEKQNVFDGINAHGVFLEPAPLVLTDEVCLALVVYYEARADVPEGRLAVAWVAANRARAAHTSICYEVFKPWQFSWTADPAIWKGRPIDYAWVSAAKTAEIILEPGALDFTRGANHFHTLDTHPNWADHMPSVGVYGAHIFYRAGR